MSDLAIERYEADEGCFVATDGKSFKHVTLCSLTTIMHVSPKENRDEWVK